MKWWSHVVRLSEKNEGYRMMRPWPAIIALTVLSIASAGCGEGELDHTIDVERAQTLWGCDQWHTVDADGHQGTRDIWALEDVEVGAVIDFRFDAYTLPNRFEIDYPMGTTVVETGWRGSSWYDGEEEYPQGISGPGHGDFHELFELTGPDEIEVRVFGAAPGTSWTYSLRCRS
jgi:hypothetical protein